METRNNHAGIDYDDIVPAIAIHPGEVLEEEIKARGISREAFAEQLGMQRSHLNELLRGKRDFTPAFALKLEDTLHIHADTWTNLQASYERDLIRIKAHRAHTRHKAAVPSEPAVEYAAV